jgi:hypothetical protein
VNNRGQAGTVWTIQARQSGCDVARSVSTGGGLFKETMEHYKYPPSEKDQLIGSTWRCKCNNKVATVEARGSVQGVTSTPIVWLSNGEDWDLPGFFNNWEFISAKQNTSS